MTKYIGYSNILDIRKYWILDILPTLLIAHIIKTISAIMIESLGLFDGQDLDVVKVETLINVFINLTHLQVTLQLYATSEELDISGQIPGLE